MRSCALRGCRRNQLRAEVGVGLVHLSAQTLLVLVEEIRIRIAGAATGPLQGGIHLAAGRRGQILVGAIRVDAPAEAGGDGQVLPCLPGVADIGGHTIAEFAAALQTEGWLLGKETIAIADLVKGGAIALQWIGRAWSRSPPRRRTPRPRLSRNPEARYMTPTMKDCAEELGKAAAHDAVDLAAELEVVRSLGPRAIVADLLVGLERSLRSQPVRAEFNAAGSRYALSIESGKPTMFVGL